jgi:vacuolar-type H+-ATPase subunit E/Vma4
MSIIAEHLYTPEARERRREAIRKGVDEAIRQYQQSLKFLLQKPKRRSVRRAGEKHA